jgi:hypothetical protein
MESAVATPAAAATPDTSGDISAAMDNAVESAIAEFTQEQAEQEQPTEPPADASDQPVLEAEEGEEGATEDAAEDAAEVALPDGFVMVEPVADTLATDFVLKDAEGEELEVPALMVEYKANGKVRRDRLDQVVKLAQFGVYNQEREQRVQMVEQEAQAVAQQREDLAEMLAEREAQLERLLTDDEFFLAVQEQFSRENSPERRAERAEQEVVNLRVQQQMEQISAVGTQFFHSEVEPALGVIAQALPTITRDELDERFAVAMQAHMVEAPDGSYYVPMSRYDAVRKYVVDDLAIWAKMMHQYRSESATDPAREQALAERDRARVEAQKAKRQIGQALKPVTGAAAPANSKPKAKPITTVDEAMESAIASVLSTIR